MKIATFFRSFVLGAVLTFAGSAGLSAATLSQTLTFDSSDFSEPVSATTEYSPIFSGAIDLFDPSLGTLEEITLAFDFTFSSEKPSGGSASLSGSGSVFWEDLFLAVAAGGDGGGGPPGFPILLNMSLFRGDAPVSLLPLQDAQGDGFVTLLFEPSLTVTTNSSIQLDSGFMTLTYHYTAVPEPGTWGVALAGLLALAVLRRRAKSAKFRAD